MILQAWKIYSDYVTHDYFLCDYKIEDSACSFIVYNIPDNYEFGSLAAELSTNDANFTYFFSDGFFSGSAVGISFYSPKLSKFLNVWRWSSSVSFVGSKSSSSLLFMALGFYFLVSIVFLLY